MTVPVNINGIHELDFPSYVTATRSAPGIISLSGFNNLVVGFVILSGATGTNVGPVLVAPHDGSITKCLIAVKASDGATGLTFRIKRNGTDVFISDPSVAAGTTSGTVVTVTNLTSNPLSVSSGDVFTIDITSGTSTWQFTAQLE